MIQKLIIAAPQCRDVDTLYDYWRRNAIGNRAEFYRMLTTPCAERELFLSALDVEPQQLNGILFENIETSAL